MSDELGGRIAYALKRRNTICLQETKASSIRKGTIHCAPTPESYFFNAILDTKLLYATR
jgi:hypothetical protein